MAVRINALPAFAAWVTGFCLGLMGVSGAAFAQAADKAAAADGAFTILKAVPEKALTGRPNVRPTVFQAAQVNWDVLKGLLAAAPLEAVPQVQPPVIVSLPMPDGWLARFNVVESPMMEPELAAKFPEFKTYQGQGIDDPTATVRFDYTPQGFHAFIRSANGTVFIDPYDGGDTSVVASYFKQDLRRNTGWVCKSFDENPEQAPVVPAEPTKTERPAGGYGQRGGEFVTRRQYRLAVATTAEYTAFHSTLNGRTVNVNDGMAAVVTAVNRINEVYGTEVAIRFILVANNNVLIFTNPTTDGYANDGSVSDRNINQAKLDSGVGNGAYDVGHLFETGPGGIAFFRAPCSVSNKAKGLSGIDTPINDSFWVDYVAHEMGHQFDGRHNFNNCTGGPGDLVSLAYEPSSGTTIMCYAGICDVNDIQPHSDVM
ncbi:MAG: reprolysin-like metallopeptidase, partial [Phycisphaerales bacterium]